MDTESIDDLTPEQLEAFQWGKWALYIEAKKQLNELDLYPRLVAKMLLGRALAHTKARRVTNSLISKEINPGVNHDSIPLR